jgi:hypothetical protein
MTISNKKKLILNITILIILIIKCIVYFLIDPLSRFPQGGKAFFSSPSPVGEVPIAIGREGGINIRN